MTRQDRLVTLTALSFLVIVAGCTTEEIVIVRQGAGSAKPSGCRKSVCDVAYDRCAKPAPDTKCSECYSLCGNSLSAEGLSLCLDTCASVCAMPSTPAPVPSHCAADRDACRATSANLGCADGLADGKVPSTDVPSELSWQPPAAPHQGVCSAEDVDLFMSECALTSKPRCPYVSSKCQACALTQASDERWGPFVVVGKVAYVNDEGCFASVMGDGSSDGCGAKQKADSDCVVAACKHAPDDDFVDCLHLAEASVCKTAHDAAEACKASDAASVRANGAPDPEQVCRFATPGRTEAPGRLILEYFCGR